MTEANQRIASKALAAAVIGGMSLSAHADSLTNTMTNIVTVVDSCDIVAVGVDFGVVGAAIPAAGISSVVANSSAGNLITGNTTHPNAAADDGAGTDDVLTLNTGISALDGAISTVLSTVVGNVPGIYVACTTTPTAITVTSTGSGATTYNLPTTLAAAPVGTMAGKMAGVGGAATASNTVDYTMVFAGAPVVSDPGSLGLVNLYVAAYTVTGLISATQSGSVVPGFYADAAVAQVDF